MSESNQHNQLVFAMVRYVENKHPKYKILFDIQEYPGDNIPNQINGFRPDLHAISNNNKHHIIGEAKTTNDLNSQRSKKQIVSFITYLKNQNTSSFLLSIPYDSGARAKVLLYFLSKELYTSTTNFFIFDECDWWQLNELSWHLI